VWGTEKVRQKVALAAETSALYERRPTACQGQDREPGVQGANRLHAAGKEQIVRTRRRPSFEGIKQGGMAFGRKFLLDRFLITESRQRMNLSSDHFMSSQQRRHSQRFELISIHSEYRRN
jgi:hypothetical protein